MGRYLCTKRSRYQKSFNTLKNFSFQMDDEGKLQRVKVATEGLAFTMKVLSGDVSCFSSEGACPGDFGALKADLLGFGLALKAINDQKAAGEITAADALGAVAAAGAGLADTLKGTEWGDVSGCFVGDNVKCEAAEGAFAMAIGGFVSAICPVLPGCQ